MIELLPILRSGMPVVAYKEVAAVKGKGVYTLE